MTTIKGRGEIVIFTEDEYKYIAPLQYQPNIKRFYRVVR